MQPLSPWECFDAETIYGCCTITHDRNLFRGVHSTDKISNTDLYWKRDVTKRKLAEKWISMATGLRWVEQQRRTAKLERSTDRCEEDKNECEEES